MGQIVTFYSYKGGTGRTMAMANVGWILASAGHGVLMVDWDSRHRVYIATSPVPARQGAGVVGRVYRHRDGRRACRRRHQHRPRPSIDPDWHLPLADILRYAIAINWQFDKRTAGFPSRRSAESGLRGAGESFNWDNFYERLGGGTFLEALRAIDAARNDYGADREPDRRQRHERDLHGADARSDRGLLHAQPSEH